MTDERTDNQDLLQPFFDEFRQVMIENNKIIRQYDEKYLPKASQHPLPWHYLGGVKSYRTSGNTLLLECEAAFVQMVFLAPEIVHIRVQLDSDDFSDYFSYLVENRNSTVDSIVVQEGDEEDDASPLIVQFGNYSYQIDRTNSQVTCFGGSKQVFRHADGIRWRADGEVGLSMSLADDEASFGTGQRAFDLNLRGRKLGLWNVDPAGYQRGDDPINYCVSYYLGVHQNGVYGLLWDNPAKGEIDIGASKSDEVQISAETGQLSYFFFVGNDVNSVMQRYTQVTGRMHLPPLWAIGYHQSRYSYMNEDEVLRTAQEFRDRGIPCDAIYLDIHYMIGYRIFTWDKDIFPDMQGMVKRLHDRGLKVVTILDPGVKVDEGYEGYDSGLESGVFLTYPDGENVAGVVWPGLCHFPDFTASQARDWWTNQLDALLSCGIDGLWNDMNEPLIFQPDAFPTELPIYVRHDKEGRGGTHHELHNVYGTQMGRASRQALEKHRPDKRQFSIIRAGAAGAQRYTSSWTGDNIATWDDLRLSISMVLQMGLSGISFTGADVGGFEGDTDGELLTRWTQAAALHPFFRNHSAIGTARQEPWSFGQPYENCIREAIELRYRLLPYLYTAFAQCSYYGYPIIRPVFMAEPHNPHIRTIDDAYLLGDKILVAPVMTQHALRRTVYLPEGDWYNFHTNERFIGGTVISVDAPLNVLPLFVKSGTVLPLYPIMRYTREKAIDTLTLRVYTDSGETTIYEDAGEGLAYQDDDYRWVTYRCMETTDALTIERTIEGNYSPEYTSIELQVVGATQAINTVEVDGKALDNIRYQGDVMIVTIDADFKNVKVAI
ncbi:MAG: glycoside hydrolase family 31 protein [Anaerolineae bacterium]|nr:glycoside hydrolase family 31 protein [Anaerolineae bacterium]MDQ7035098.1 glycoside hydrolase family 31 protein [Anaerolineae bacterium]